MAEKKTLVVSTWVRWVVGVTRAMPVWTWWASIGKVAEHACGVGKVCGFVEDLLFADYGGVGAEDGGFGVEGMDGLRLFEGQALDVGGGGLVGAAGLVDVGGEDVEAEAGLGEQVAAAGGGGGEDNSLIVRVSVVSFRLSVVTETASFPWLPTEN